MRKFLEVQMSFKVTCVRSRFFLAGFAPSDSAIVTKRRRKFADLPVFRDCLYLGKLVSTAICWSYILIRELYSEY